MHEEDTLDRQSFPEGQVDTWSTGGAEGTVRKDVPGIRSRALQTWDNPDSQGKHPTSFLVEEVASRVNKMKAGTPDEKEGRLEERFRGSNHT